MNEYELVRLYGGNSLLQATLEPFCHDPRSNSSTAETGRICRNKESLLGHVVQRAKSLGTWIEVESEIGRMIGNGQENDVFISADSKFVIKLNNFGLLPNDATCLSGFIHRLLSHNKLFPGDAYTVIGLSYNSNSEPCIVLKQPYINAVRYASGEEIDAFLESLDYTVDMDDIWFNGTYEISDVKPTNVLIDQNGSLHFIDAIVNEISFQIDRVNKISIKHPGKRTT